MTLLSGLQQHCPQFAPFIPLIAHAPPNPPAHPPAAGGSAAASDAIHREVLLLRKAGKPVVVSMGNAAASGELAGWL